MIRSSHGRFTGRRLFVGCCLGLGLTACQPAQRTQLPTLREVRSRLESGSFTHRSPTGRYVLLHVTRLDLPLETSTQEAWALVEQTSLPRPVVDAWRANGMDIGILPNQSHSRFLELVTPVRGEHHQQIALTERLVPVSVSPKQVRPAPLNVVSPVGTTEALTVRGGRCQLLARIHPDGQNRVRLELVPHYFKPRITIQPRPPHEKALDGHLFHGLSLKTSPPQDGWLVVGMSDQRPPAPTPTDPSVDPGNGATTFQATDAPTDRLGHLLFTASRYGKPRQHILVIWVNPTKISPAGHPWPG